ncbi:hypothetical protein BKA57DRAFT_467989 [Linnemannia elongata]|nr:hypothetical protein BKA57DRAFT_467989 [Linnemannia elongata]
MRHIFVCSSLVVPLLSFTQLLSFFHSLCTYFFLTYHDLVALLTYFPSCTITTSIYPPSNIPFFTPTHPSFIPPFHTFSVSQKTCQLSIWFRGN